MLLIIRYRSLKDDPFTGKVVAAVRSEFLDMLSKKIKEAFILLKLEEKRL